MVGWARRGAIAAVVVSLVAAADAEAGALPPAGAELGGGVTPDRVTSRNIEQNTLVSARVGGDQRTVRLAGWVAADCSRNDFFMSREFEGQVKLAEDGSFSARFAGRRGYLAAAGPGTVAISGTFDGARASGTVRLDGSRTINRRRVECRGPDRPFELRPPDGDTGAPAPAPAGVTLYGLTDTRIRRVRLPFVVHTAADGRSAGATGFSYRISCSGFKVATQNFTPAFEIAADGSFNDLEKFTVRYSDAVETVRIRLAGRFLTGPVVEGTLSVSTTTRFTKGRAKGRTQRCPNASRARFRAVG